MSAQRATKLDTSKQRFLLVAVIILFIAFCVFYNFAPFGDFAFEQDAKFFRSASHYFYARISKAFSGVGLAKDCSEFPIDLIHDRFGCCRRHLHAKPDVNFKAGCASFRNGWYAWQECRRF